MSDAEAAGCVTVTEARRHVLFQAGLPGARLGKVGTAHTRALEGSLRETDASCPPGSATVVGGGK